jgi:YHS domain-containing protein
MEVPRPEEFFMRQARKHCIAWSVLVVMLAFLTSPLSAEVQSYTPERLRAARQAAPYAAIHLLMAEAAPDLAEFAKAVANDGVEVAGVRHIVILPVGEAELAAARELPLLVLADGDNAAPESLAVRESDLPASLIFERGADKPLEKVYERGGRRTPNLRSLNTRLSRAWRHPAITRFALDNGVAADGMDLVSYQAGGAPVAGLASLACDYRGITYRFATADNRRRFAADPEKYLPAAGGWCAMAMARGEQVEADASTFTVHDGRLHLFYKGIYGDARAEFLADPAANAAAAEEQWKRVVGK